MEAISAISSDISDHVYRQSKNATRRQVMPLTSTFNLSASQLGQCLLCDWRTNHRSICTWSPVRPTQQAVELMHIHFSESWATDFKSFLQDNQLANEEIAVIGARGIALPLQDGLGSYLGELRDVPARDHFPLRIWKNVSKADPSQAATTLLVHQSTDQPVDRPACHRVLAASRTSLT